MQLWLNGTLADERDAHVSATSAGLLLGWGAFTTLGVFAGRPFLLDKHLARLRGDCHTLGLELSYSDDELLTALESVLSANKIKNGIARLTVTARGDGRWNLDTGSDVTILAHTGAPDLRPVTLWLLTGRLSESGPLTSVKSTSYAAHLRAWRIAQTYLCHDALLTEDGNVRETSRANIFWVKDGELFTPSLQCGCLPGIAREWVIEQFRAQEGQFKIGELQSADEVFVTASTFGARGVAALREARRHGKRETTFSQQGEITRRVMQRWCEAIENQPDFS